MSCPLLVFKLTSWGGAEYPDAPKTNKIFFCVFAQLASVRMGKARAFNQSNVGCFGTSGMFGFAEHPISDEMGANYGFLIKEEKFYKTAEQVEEIMRKFPPAPAQGKHLIFKRWDLLTASDQPPVVSFFCNPDTIAAFTPRQTAIP